MQGNVLKNNRMMSENGDIFLIAILATLVFLCTLIIVGLCVVICIRLGLGKRKRCNSCRQHNRDWNSDQHLCNACNRLHYNQQNPHPHYPSYNERYVPHLSGPHRDRMVSNYNPIFVPDVAPDNPAEGVDLQQINNTPSDEIEVQGHTTNAHSAWMKMQKAVDRSITTMIGNKLVVYTTRRVGYNGAFLALDNMGISVEVPQGAVSEGQTKSITLLLNWDLGDNPFMQSNQALVSPVVFVGPHGIKLNKPCILNYMHCSFDKRHIQVMKSETDLFEQKNWEVMCRPNDNKSECEFTSSTCKLLIDTFTLYTCLQCPPDGQKGQKWLQVAVFSEGIKQDIEHQQVRVYFLNKTNCALQWAIHNEAQYGGKLICPEKLFLMSGTEKDIFVILTYLSRGWTVVDQARPDPIRIKYLSIWHGQCPHVSLCFRRENPSMHEFNLNLEVRQEGRENESERIIAQIIQPEAEINSDNPIPVPITTPMTRAIPQCLRTRLQILLDVPCPLAKNWKGLAEKLGYDALIPAIETRTIGSSPTEVILQVMEQKAKTLHDLQRLLAEMGRADAVNAIQEYLEPPEEPDTMVLKPYREAVENENEGYATSDQRQNEF